jgi:hypothetical protein
MSAAVDKFYLFGITLLSLKFSCTGATLPVLGTEYSLCGKLLRSVTAAIQAKQTLLKIFSL